jgi:hypothetical protein
MPRGPAPAWRARKQPVADAYILASIEQAGGKYHAETGFYKTLRLRLDDNDDAREWHRAFRRSAVYLHRNGIADIGIHVEIKRDRKGQYLEYVAINKAHTYRFIIQRYGPDRSKWPYDVHRRGGA